MRGESDCHKDFVNQLCPPETVCYDDESFDETLICEKVGNRQTFLTILRNIQFLSRQGLALRGNNNEANFEQLMKLKAKVDPKLLLGWRKSDKSTFIMIRKMKS